jgi:hypothetical protein
MANDNLPHDQNQEPQIGRDERDGMIKDTTRLTTAAQRPVLRGLIRRDVAPLMLAFPFSDGVMEGAGSSRPHEISTGAHPGGPSIVPNVGPILTPSPSKIPITIASARLELQGTNFAKKLFNGNRGPYVVISRLHGGTTTEIYQTEAAAQLFNPVWARFELETDISGLEKADVRFEFRVMVASRSSAGKEIGTVFVTLEELEAKPITFKLTNPRGRVRGQLLVMECRVTVRNVMD